MKLHVHTIEGRILIGLLFLLISGFLLLTYAVIKYPPSPVDIDVSLAVQKNHSPLMDQFMIFVSCFGRVPVSVIMALISSGTFYIFKYRRESVFTLLTMVSGLVSSVIKILVNRPRPTKELVRIVEIAREKSFPSGHTLFYVVFFGLLIVMMINLKSVSRTIRIGLIVFSAIMILLVPFSRIYLGAHWVTDVTGGVLLGIICLAVLSYYYLSPESALGDE